MHALRCPHHGREAVRRLHCRQHVHAGLRLSAGPRADRLGRHRAGHRAQRRGGRDEPQRLPLRPAGGARARRARPPDRRRRPASAAEAADAGQTSSPSAPSSSPTTRTRRWPSATARAWRAWPRSSASRHPGRSGPRRGGRARLLQAAGLQGRVRGGAALRRARPSRRRSAEQFEARRKLEFHLAPPLLARRDKATGEPRKMRFGAWMLPVFRLLAKGKRLRGTPCDVFGYSAERKLERQMIADYEKLLDEIAQRLTPADARHGGRARLAGARHQGLRPHQGAQLQGGQGARGGPARRAAQPLAHRAQGGGVT